MHYHQDKDTIDFIEDLKLTHAIEQGQRNGGVRKYHSYNNSVMQLILAFRISELKQRKTNRPVNDIRIIELPYIAGQPSPDLRVLAGIQQYFNIAGIINFNHGDYNKPGHYAAFYIVKGTSTVWYNDPYGDDPPNEFVRDCVTLNLVIDNIKYKIQRLDDVYNCGPFVLLILDTWCKGKSKNLRNDIKSNINNDRIGVYNTQATSRRKYDEAILLGSAKSPNLNILGLYENPNLDVNTIDVNGLFWISYESIVPRYTISDNSDGDGGGGEDGGGGDDGGGGEDGGGIIGIDEDEEDEDEEDEDEDNGNDNDNDEDKDEDEDRQRQRRRRSSSDDYNDNDVDVTTTATTTRTRTRIDLWNDVNTRQPFMYRNVNINARTTCTITPREPKVWARYLMDNDNYSYVRCDVSLLQCLRKYIFHRVRRGKYSMKLQKYCKYERNDFVKWRKFDNKTYFILKPGLINKQQQQQCTLPTSNRKDAVFLPIAKWQCTRELCKYLFVKTRIDDGSTRTGLLNPSYECTLEGIDIGLKD